MALAFEDLKVLKTSERLCDAVWEHVRSWDIFARDTIGNQFVRAVDSIGANIAEAYGRYHFGEKLKFYYYARGSLFETKYWLNRALSRHLLSTQQFEEYEKDFTQLGRSLNNLINSTRNQRNGRSSKSVREENNNLYETNTDDALNTLPNH